MEIFLKSLGLSMVIGAATASPAWAISGTGNGGDGLRLKDGKLYLLDLVENGTQEHPFLDPLSPMTPAYLSFVKKGLPDVGENVQNLVAQKLSDLSVVDVAVSTSMLWALQLYNWSWVDYPLKDVRDDETLIDIPDSALVQLAVRDGRDIYISRPAWDELASDANRAALILHEVAYSLVKPEFAGADRQGIKYFDQSSKKARSWVRQLFSKKFSDATASDIARWTAGNVVNFGSGIRARVGVIPDGAVVDYNGMFWLGGWKEDSDNDVAISLSDLDKIDSKIEQVCKKLSRSGVEVFNISYARYRSVLNFSTYLSRYEGRTESRVYVDTRWNNPTVVTEQLVDNTDIEGSFKTTCPRVIKKKLEPYLYLLKEYIF